MTESSKHQELKVIARKELLVLGFEESKILVDSKYITINYHGYDYRFRPDVYASNGKKVAVECGNFPKWKRPIYYSYFGEENVKHIPYPPFYGRYTKKDLETDMLTIPEQKQFLVDSYNKQIYATFKDDAIFDLQEFNETNQRLFNLDGHHSHLEINPDYGSKDRVMSKTVWMNFPSSKTLSKTEYENNIHWGALYYSKSVIALTIIFTGKPACEKFLGLSTSTHKRILECLNRLSEKWFTRDGYGFWDKTPMPPLDREYNNPIPCNTLTEEDYDEILENLSNLMYMQKNNFKVSPFLDLAKGYFEDYELPEAIAELKELYKILLKPESKIDAIAKNIKKLNQWEWFIQNYKEWDLFYKVYTKENSEQVTIQDFKKSCKYLRDDPDYHKYVIG